MIRRRVAKNSLGDYKPSAEDLCFKYMQSDMREYLRVYFKSISCSDDTKELLNILNENYSNTVAKKIWFEYKSQKQFINEKCNDKIPSILNRPAQTNQPRYQPIINERVDCTVFKNTRGENIYPELFNIKLRPDFNQ